MIHSNPNPVMTPDEIRKFRQDLLRRMQGNLTPEEKRMDAEKRKNAERITRMILAKNGGKNPILGY